METLLDPQELEAIQGAIRQAARSQPALDPAARPASPIALIADDRAADQARPAGLRIAARWAREARRAVAQSAGEWLEVDVIGAELTEASSLKDELAAAFTRTVSVSGRPGQVVVSATGRMIEALAARLLGAPCESPADRPPSALAMGVFAPIGETLAAALADAWRDEQGCEAHAAATPWRQALADGPVVVVTLSVAGRTSGRLRFVARAETIVLPPPRPEAIAVPQGLIDEVLGAVPVEVRVELGTARMSVAQLAALRPGALIALDRMIDDPAPVRCGGVVKAHGRPVLSGGALAVQIVATVGRSGSGT